MQHFVTSGGPVKTEKEDAKGPTQKALQAERQKAAAIAGGDVANLPADFKRYPNVSLDSLINE